MSIRYKILLGCLSLTMLTVILGGITRESEKALGDVAIRIYDQAFLALSYLRAGQNGLANLRTAIHRREAEAMGADAAAGSGDHGGLVAAWLPPIRDDLDVARARAMSVEGSAAAARLGGQIDAIQLVAPRDTKRLLAELEQLQHEFDTAVEIYAGDGFRYRRSVGQMVESTLTNAWIAIAVSVAVALLITSVLSRSIVPAMREAVELAKAIAGGKLDNVIAPRGNGEPAQLLGALAAMQAAICGNLERINALMLKQRAKHADQLGEQNTRFEAALNNMSQGLCMFDEASRLVVMNPRYLEIFGLRSDVVRCGMAFSEVVGQLIEHGCYRPDLTTDTLCEMTRTALSNEATTPVYRELADGRVIAATHRRMSSGGWVSTFEDVTDRRRIEERLSFMARHDALTGLPNRTLFREHMEQLREQGARPAVLCLDVDRFKNVNDTLGHPVGDGLLRAVADRLRAAALPTDLVVRMGGDEFAMVRADDGGPASAAALAAEIVDAVARPFEIDGHHVTVSASVGIAFAELAGLAAADLLKNADMALYRAKGEGRSTFRFFEAEMDACLQAKRSLELDLRAALRLDQFELFYQPLVDTALGRVAGFEALLRWRHPERGLVSPASFIPLAEEIGLIQEIGDWVIETACAEAVSWPDDIKVAVNLSPLQFRNRLLASWVATCLSKAGLSPSRLELEITESVLLADSQAVLTILNELKLLGVSISMDDFGTGYSSLSYLRKFPFDKIKIDQCFTRSLFETDGLAIVRAVIGLGRSLNMAVVAEGVETCEQLRVLEEEGCFQAQGYLYSKPRPAFELASLRREIERTAFRRPSSLAGGAARDASAPPPHGTGDILTGPALAVAPRALHSTRSGVRRS